MVNITFLVADDGLTDEDLLIGLPVLEHLKLDTRTMLERNCRDLDGMDCSQVGNPTRTSPGGSVSRLMIARLNGYQSHKSIHRVRVPADRPRVNYHTARTEEDHFVDPFLLDPLEIDQHQEIREAEKGLRQTIRNNGILAEDATAIDEVIEEHIDLFRTSFSSGPPAKVRPLRIELTPDARPVKVRLRNYSEEQREFLSDMVAKLVRNGMAFPNPTSAWACAPLLVPKPGPARFRFTVDLRPVNKFTVKHQYPVPNLDHELTKLGGSRYFATFDLSHGYWQFELEPESRSLQSFITPDGIYCPTRVLHGTTNAVTHLQSSLAEIIPDDLKDNILRWLDDILLHNRTVKGLLQPIRTFLGVCVEWNIKLHPAKCVFFARSVRWCGRLVSSKGIRYDPKRMDGLLKIGTAYHGRPPATVSLRPTMDKERHSEFLRTRHKPP